jgi:hypothetical protein
VLKLPFCTTCNSILSFHSFFYLYYQTWQSPASKGEEKHKGPHSCCNGFAPYVKLKPIYLWWKVVCFVLQLWDPLNQDASDCVLDIFGKLSMRRGAWAWFHDVWTCGAKVLEYWMISSLKIKFNHSWKFRRNWNVPLVFVGKILMRSIKWNLFDKIWIQNVGDIDLKVISAAENSNKFRKTKVLQGKISWERGNTWRLTIQFKHDFLSYLAVQKINTYTAKQCSHVEFPYFVMGSHLGQQHRSH